MIRPPTRQPIKKRTHKAMKKRDHAYPGEPLLRMSFENTSEDLRWRRFRSGGRAALRRSATRVARMSTSRAASVSARSRSTNRCRAVTKVTRRTAMTTPIEAHDGARHGRDGAPWRTAAAPDRFARASPCVCRACTRHRRSQTLPNEVGQTRRSTRITPNVDGAPTRASPSRSPSCRSSRLTKGRAWWSGDARSCRRGATSSPARPSRSRRGGAAAGRK